MMRCVVAILLLSGALTAQTEKTEATATLSGIVRDSNGAPIAGVMVAAFLGPESRIVNLPKSATAITDEAGSYSIEGLPPKTYSVKTERDTASKRIKLDAGDKATLDFILPADPSISGRVVDQDNNPAVDAFVWLLKPTWEGGVLKQIVTGPKVTAEDGSYSFNTGLDVNRRYYVLVDRPPPEDIVPAAAADLKERSPIEVPTYYPSATRMESAAAVILQPGENRAQVDVKIATAPFFCVEGKVQLSGEPVATDFAIYEAPLAASRLARVRAYSGVDGRYHVCGLSPGLYRISTDKGFAEFAISASDVQRVDLSLDAATLTLQADWDDPSAVPGLPELNPQARATLRKIAVAMGYGDTPGDEDLKKAANRLLHFDPRNASESALVEWREFLEKLQSDPDIVEGSANLMKSFLPLTMPVEVTLVGDRYVGRILKTVPPGEYAIEAYAPDAYAKEMTYNGLKLADRIARIAPGESGTLHLQMSRAAAELTVAVVDTEGKPVADAMAIVVPDSVNNTGALNRVQTRGKTDQNGNFNVKSLAPGKYRVLATSQAVRWDVPEDLEKVLLLMFQAKTIDVDGKVPARVSLEPVPIY